MFSYFIDMKSPHKAQIPPSSMSEFEFNQNKPYGRKGLYYRALPIFRGLFPPY